MIDTLILSGRFGRGWFAVNENWIAQWHAGLVNAIKRELDEMPVTMKYSWPDEIRSSVNQIDASK